MHAFALGDKSACTRARAPGDMSDILLSKTSYRMPRPARYGADGQDARSLVVGPSFKINLPLQIELKKAAKLPVGATPAHVIARPSRQM
jgi:hypothetical protein